MSEQMGGFWPGVSAYSQKSVYAIRDRTMTPQSILAVILKRP